MSSNAEQAKHTATPWRAVSLGCGYAVGNENHQVAYTNNGSRSRQAVNQGVSFEDEAKANAEFIVRACNAHDDLVKALNGLLAVFEYYKEPEKVAAVEAARAALSRAGA